MSDPSALWADSLDEASILQLVNRQEQEHLHLDFKTVNHGDFRSRDDRRSLAEAISGFANSDGGVVIWGIEARKTADSIDAASALKLIPNVAACRSRLEQLTGEATLPRPVGVRHRDISIESDAGVIVSIIPRDNRTVRMAKLGEDRYFKRSGDSFYRMEHYDILDALARRAQPELEIRVTPKFGSATFSDDAPDIILLLEVSIHNVGSVLARFVAIRLDGTADMLTVEPLALSNSTHGLRPIFSVDSTISCVLCAGGADDVIHPGCSVVAARAKRKLTPRDFPSVYRLHWALWAAECSMSQGQISVSREEVGAQLESFAAKNRFPVAAFRTACR